MERLPSSPIDKFVVPVTVTLTFISFWRAAAIVLADLGSSAYYVGGITEKAIGKSAPWFIFGIMLLSYAVRAVYIESCSMFVRGGVFSDLKIRFVNVVDLFRLQPATEHPHGLSDRDFDTLFTTTSP